MRPRGVVCFVDKAVAQVAAPDRVERTIADGRRFTIIDRPRPPEEWVARFAEAGMRVDVETIGTRFCLGQGTRA